MNDDTLPPLPELRPVRLQGKAYYTELRRILKEIRYDLKADAERLMQENGRKFTLRHACILALKYRINLKATVEALEDERIVPYGAYDRMLSRGLRPMTVLRETWAALHTDAALEPWQHELQKWSAQ